ncbi:MAG: alkaline phosphatase family protein [Deltaproteobacteria bacterium]|nr:alkaline phosphatase family protein [Deltaproteobacteria bacterium]
MQPLIIVGIDGADWAVIEKSIAYGQLPNISALIKRGLRTELNSTMPPATLPAWMSFLCGANPAEHGLVDMFVHPPQSYAIRPATTELQKLPTFLSRLAQKGLAVASLGVPGTYPPDKSLGLCIAGFDAPGVSHASKNSIHPTSAYRQIQSLGGWRYAIVNEQQHPGSKLAQKLINDLTIKERVILWAYAKQHWDVFFVHIQAADTAGHHLWHTYDVTSPRFRNSSAINALTSVYSRIDQLIGRLLAKAPTNARVMLISDHGMGGASDIAVHLNRVLSELDLLRFKNNSKSHINRYLGVIFRNISSRLPAYIFSVLLRILPNTLIMRALSLSRALNIDYANSAAFSDELDYAPSVWLNRRGVFPYGQVDDTKADAILKRIRHALLALRHPDSNAPLVNAVYLRDEIFSHPAAAITPDLIIEPAWPSGFRASFLPSFRLGPKIRRLATKELTAGRGYGMPGVHRQQGIFLAVGPLLPAIEAPILSIAEAGALVYALAGITPPPDLKVKLQGFWQELALALTKNDKLSNTPSAQLCPNNSAAIPAALDATQQAALTERLRNWGYID